VNIEIVQFAGVSALKITGHVQNVTAIEIANFKVVVVIKWDM
jgi:hypothetical protein